MSAVETLIPQNQFNEDYDRYKIKEYIGMMAEADEQSAPSISENVTTDNTENSESQAPLWNRKIIDRDAHLKES